MLDAVIAAPATSRIRGLSTEVTLGPHDGLRHESVANLDSVQLVPRTRLIRRVGRVRPATIGHMPCPAYRDWLSPVGQRIRARLIRSTYGRAPRSSISSRYSSSVSPTIFSIEKCCRSR